jgi:Patatin-like phospholipase
MNTAGDCRADAQKADKRGMRKFHEIFECEVEAISQRRKHYRRPAIALEEENHERDDTPIKRPRADANVVGLALSGGGIRSAAFCLGAMQALDAHGIIEKIDYLSTVSGGGYIGTSMTAAMSHGTAGKFPFSSDLQTGEVAGVQHIRDHSNYLFPPGTLNIFSNIVVYLRGLFANVMLLLPWLLFAAAFTIWSNPTENSLVLTKIGDYFLNLPVPVPHFGLTLHAFAVFFIVVLLWALWRSTRWRRTISDIGPGALFFALLLAVLLIVAFWELQPLLLEGMFGIEHAVEANKQPAASEGLLGTVSSWLKTLAALFASIGTVVGFCSKFLADALKRNTEKPGAKAFVTRIAIKLAMYVAGAAVPLGLWVVYLYLSYWGILSCKEDDCAGHAPWLTALANKVLFASGAVPILYLVIGIPILVIGWILSPNANSLHQLYRDRLSKAFLFDPTHRVLARGWFGKEVTGAEADTHLRGGDLKPLNALLVSKLNPHLAPYHLINTALNIEASKFANRRGRNADFFVFSPLFTGSEATGYVGTIWMEKKMAGLTAGAAMAISGAAASSNMGSATIKPLVPTLAILNIRLGYWLTNPRKVAGDLKKPMLQWLFDQLYFMKELFGLLTEDSETVYLTDGGHIENLGIYELFRRRCKLIIAIDSEADPEMSFRSLVTLERYARIDFGLRIGLPWAAVRDATQRASKQVLETGGLPPSQAAHGPHCALGTIYYPRKNGDENDANSTGVLLYVKSSFTGDENDYVVDYKRRNPDFPHETTLDQLFTEEQFEVYRNLGFHTVNSAFKRTNNDLVSMEPAPAKWQGAATTLPLERQMREILGLPLN